MPFKIFPFCPEVLWKTSGGIIKDKLDVDRWNKIFKDRERGCVIAYGGLLESFLSLSIAEIYAKHNPILKLSWAGNTFFQPLVRYSGLFKDCVERDLSRYKSLYPCPIFIENDYVYFNSLINCYKYYDIAGIAVRENTGLVSKQILLNSHLGDKIIIPKMRRFEPPEKIIQWMKLNKFNPNLPFVLLVPGKLYSNHKKDLIKNWNSSSYKALANLCSNAGYQVVVLTDNNVFVNQYIKVAPPSLEFLLYFIMNNPKLVVTESVDVSLVSGLLADSKLVTNKQVFNLNIKANLEFCGRKNSVLRKSRYISPIEIYNFLVKE